MSTPTVLYRLRSKIHRTCADRLFRRGLPICTDNPIVSFTFDDFPESASSVGGSILERFGLLGTYYVSLGLEGKHDASGPMFKIGDLARLREAGHELGCHTFSHCDSGNTCHREFIESVESNKRALRKLYPDAIFQTFSFPKSAPKALSKRAVGARFECCRGGGQTFNQGIADLNYLRAYFLEQAKGDLASVRQMIDCNKKAKGWLIFATHDVCKNPSPYGCTPEFFEAVVRYSVESRSIILPVTRALETLRRSADPS